MAADRGDLLAGVNGYLGDTILLPAVPVHDRELLLPVLEYQSVQQRRRKQPMRGVPSVQRSLGHLSSHQNLGAGLDGAAALTGCPGCGAPAPSGLSSRLHAYPIPANEHPVSLFGALCAALIDGYSFFLNVLQRIAERSGFTRLVCVSVSVCAVI